jgi:hypothetical protein
MASVTDHFRGLEAWSRLAADQDHAYPEAARAQSNLTPLALNERLTRAAYEHCRWMATTETLDHVGENGSTARDRARAQGLVGGRLGENNLAGAQTCSRAMIEWLNSDDRRPPKVNRLQRLLQQAFWNDPLASARASFWPSCLSVAGRAVLLMKQRPCISCVSLLQSLHLNLLVQAPCSTRQLTLV